MSHMPTDQQPGVTTLAVQQAGVAIGAGPYRTLNFQSGATVTDAGGGVAAIAVTGGGGGTIADGSVTLAKLVAQADTTIVGRALGAGSGSPTALSATQAKALLAIAAADVSGLAAVATSGSATDLGAGTLAAARLASNSIVAAKFAAAATQRVFGRNTAGAGSGEEVTASQLLDWASSTNGVLLTRTGGSWAALANVTTDNGDLVFAGNTAPVAPSAGSSKVYGASVGGRPMLGILNAAGARALAQPLEAERAVWAYQPRIDGGAVLTAYNARLDIVGTLTARTWANTSAFTRLHRVAYVSATAAGSQAGARAAGIWCSTASGFFLLKRFAISDAVLVTTANMFAGLSGTTTALADVGPETLTQLIGVGCTSGDTQLQLYAAAGSAQARTALGASFPVNTVSTDAYQLALYCAPGASSITWEVIRILTGDHASGTVSAVAAVPTAALTNQLQRSNGGGSTAVGVDILSAYGEVDN